MQEDYIGQSRDLKRFPYDSVRLINNINSRIDEYKNHNDLVIYIKNRGKGSRLPPIIPELQIVSDLIFEKNRASCFSNDDLLACLKDNPVKEIELAGVDGNSCVGLSALAGIKHGFSVRFSLSCIGIVNAERFVSTREKLLQANVQVLD